MSKNISKIKPKTRGNSAPKTAPAALTAPRPFKPSSGNDSDTKKYAVGVIILNRKAPNSV